MTTAFPILSSIVVLPVLGAVLLFLLREDEGERRVVRNVALIVSTLVFAETLPKNALGKVQKFELRKTLEPRS